MMKKLLLVFAVLTLSACQTVTKISHGEQVVGGRILVNLEGPWNQFDRMAVPTWTVDGITVDRLQFFVAVKDGAPLIAGVAETKDKRPLTFRASMPPHEIVTLYQNLLTADGSTFTLDKLETASFLGAPGFRFQFTLIRRVDEVRLTGFGYGAVVNGEFHAILYQAPRLGFFPRYQGQIDKMAQTARLRS